MSTALFELGYDFADSFEKDLFVIERTAEIALSEIYDQMDICVIMESDSSKSSNELGGLFGLIQKGLKVITDMISAVITKIKELFVGKTATSSTVKFDKNPKDLVEKADKIITDDTKMLPDLLSGKIDPEKVIKTVDSHQDVFDKVLPYVGSAAALASGILINEKVLVKWKRDIDASYSINHKEMTDYAKLYAKSATLSNKHNVIKEAAQYLMKDINNASTKGSNALTQFAKTAYAENFIKKQLSDEAGSMDSTIGGIMYRGREKMKQRLLNQETKRLHKQSENIDSNSRKNKSEKERTAQSRENYTNARSERYSDVKHRTYLKKKSNTELHDKIRKLNTTARTK